MADGDVETFDKRGQWVNRVVGEPERSSSYSSRDEAVEAGAALAAELGTAHLVHDAEPTGAITDPDADSEPDRDTATGGDTATDPDTGTGTDG